jgi:rod shape-determining protein MreB and related proteins
MLDYIFGLVSHDVGIDLGTANTLVYVVGKGIAIREPSVVARHKKSKHVLSIGTEAKKMIGKTPVTIEAVRPIVSGVIADFDATEYMLASFIKKVHAGGGLIPRIPKPRVAVGIPSGVTDVERRAVQDALLSAGARNVYLIEQPMAAAIGAGLPISQSSGVLIVDIGAGRTEMAVISLGGIVLYRSIKTAGEAMDQAIIHYLRLRHSLLIGDQTAEEIKLSIGSAFPVRARKLDQSDEKKAKQAVVRGRDLESGLPVSLKISDEEVKEAIMPSVHEIISAIQDLLEETPPELVSDMVTKGLVLTGGGAMLPGLDKLIAEEVRLPVWVTEDPLTSVARGCGKAIEDPEVLKSVRIVSRIK